MISGDRENRENRKKCKLKVNRKGESEIFDGKLYF